MTDQPAQRAAVEQSLEISSRRVDGAVVLGVSGELDILTAPRLRAAVDDAFQEPDGTAVILDLTGVTFLGSSGLAALVDAVTEARRRGEPLPVVVNHSRPVLRPLQLTGLDQILTLYRTVEEALVG